MEIPRNYLASIKFAIPDDVVCAPKYIKNGTTVTMANITPATGATEVSVPLPYAAVHEEDTITVSITYTIDTIAYTKSKTVDVYTPYLELWEIKDILGSTTSIADCWEAEAAARHIINAHTGQTFGLFKDSVEVMANGGEALRMPIHTLKIDKILEGANVQFDRTVITGDTFLGEDLFLITGSGWFIKRPEWAAGTSAWSGEVYTSDPITVPYFNKAAVFTNDVVYTLTGDFGYYEVPDGVKAAAALLTNDYACGDSAYRDRYLESIKSSDWRIAFSDGAYRRTGNARADKLLSPYVVNRFQVI